MADASTQAIAALMSGQSLDSISTDIGSSADSPAPAESGTESSEGAENSEPGVDLDRMAEGTQEESNEQTMTSEPSPKADDRYEVVEIGGKKYRVDTTDREQVRKAVRMAARMQKFQSDRDRLASKLEARDKEYGELKSTLDKLEQYKDDPKALVKIFSGGKIDIETLVKQEAEKARLRDEATPEERSQMDLQEKLAFEQGERKRLQQMMETHLKEAKAKEETAQITHYKAQLEPAFEKVRYAGKLGNPTAEESIDRTLWREAISRLEEYPEDVQLTPELVNKEFRAVKATLDQIVKMQTDDRVKKATTDRKRQAKETAQVQATRGNENTTIEKEFAQKVRGGDLTSILKNPSKYFSILGK